MLNSMFPLSIEFNTGNLSECIHGNGVATDAKKRTSFTEVSRSQSFNERAEFRQRRVNRFRVLTVRLHQNIHIFRDLSRHEVARGAPRRKLRQSGITFWALKQTGVI